MPIIHDYIIRRLVSSRRFGSVFLSGDLGGCRRPEGCVYFRFRAGKKICGTDGEMDGWMDGGGCVRVCVRRVFLHIHGNGTAAWSFYCVSFRTFVGVRGGVCCSHAALRPHHLYLPLPSAPPPPTPPGGPSIPRSRYHAFSHASATAYSLLTRLSSGAIMSSASFSCRSRPVFSSHCLPQCWISSLWAGQRGGAGMRVRCNNQRMMR